MTGKKWVELNEPMGDCRCCIHQDECAPLKKQLNGNGKYRFRCPILIEVDEDIVYVGRSKSEKKEGMKNDG